MLIDQLRIQHQDNISRAERLREAVVVQLTELLGANDVTLGVPMESRIKSWTSIAEKLERKQLELNSIFELQDLIGVRTILLFRSDQTRVITLISANFEVVSSEDTGTRLGDSEFGYQSQHFVLRLPKSWLSLPSLASLDDFYIELQVRTLAQHIWAAASHKLQYKHEAGVPPPLRRTINRVSALLETVDLEFERVLDERRNYVSQTGSALAEKERLNVDSLASLLSELFPPQNRKDDEPYAELLGDLDALGIRTPEKLRNIVLSHMEKIRQGEAERVREHRAGNEQSPESDTSDRIARGVFYAHVGLAREGLRAEFGDDRVLEVMRKQRPPIKKASRKRGG